jgi:hypothetical protein
MDVNDVYRDGGPVKHSAKPKENLYVGPGYSVAGMNQTLMIHHIPEGPSLAERIIRSTMHTLAIVALGLVSLLMILLLGAISRIGQAVDDLGTPATATTGCPFGDGQCGG